MGDLVVKKSKSVNVSMPKEIVIGDPMYIDDYENNKKLVYLKKYRGKTNWFGNVELQEVCDEGYGYVLLKVTYASSENYLKVFKGGACYKGQSSKETEIGLDTATLYVGIDGNGDDLSTGSDGFVGSVCEIKKGTVLDGIVVELCLGDLDTFESYEKYVNYVFSCELK